MIEIRHLTKRYGAFTAVDDISLTVSRGEIYGFRGPNSAGKTTTIRILAGLSLPTSGVVRIAGIDLCADGTGTKSIVGYVPDRPYLYEKLTGRELLEFVVNLYGRQWRDSGAHAVGDRIGSLHRGRISASGTTAELKSNRALEDVFLELTYGND